MTDSRMPGRQHRICTAGYDLRTCVISGTAVCIIGYMIGDNPCADIINIIIVQRMVSDTYTCKPYLGIQLRRVFWRIVSRRGTIPTKLCIIAGTQIGVSRVLRINTAAIAVSIIAVDNASLGIKVGK